MILNFLSIASFLGSPLIVVLRMLVNLDIANGNKNDVCEIVSNLLGIFRAIQNAEDAVDAQTTPVMSPIFLPTLPLTFIFTFLLTSNLNLFPGTEIAYHF